MQKNINIEILRCIAIIAVILIHTSVAYFFNQDLMYNNVLSWGVINFYYAISRFAVPVFFLISAYLYFKSNKPFQLMKRIKRILLPYLAWTIIYWWLNDEHTVYSFLVKVFSEGSSYHLWFLITFLGYSILLPILLLFSKMPNKEIYKPIIMILFVFSIFLPSFYHLLLILGFQMKHITSFYLEIPQYFMYALVVPFIVSKRNVIFSCLSFLILTMINMIVNMVTAYHMGYPNEYWYEYTSFFVFVSSLIIFNIFINADFSFIKNRFAKWVYKIGECSFGIYLCHMLVFNFLMRNGFWINKGAIISPIINTVIVFIISFIFCLGCRRIKYIKEIF